GGDEDRPPARLRHLLHADLHPLLDRFLGGDRAFRPAHVVDRYVGALLTQADGDRLADSRAAAGDEGELALQSLHGVLLAVMPVSSCCAPRRYKRGQGSRRALLTRVRWGDGGGASPDPG